MTGTESTPPPLDASAIEAWAEGLFNQIMDLEDERAYLREEARVYLAERPDHALAALPGVLALQYAVTALIDEVDELTEAANGGQS
ncbi:hypothetical protein [Glycomyces sp. YM15]|uniref:hypothetical protein n=1 Tax=Glycomyces sp. YM15 TaxID=2800446 RepID=UPI00196409AE|nr:hypothetical protein [Glycomyces sp. YM15]